MDSIQQMAAGLNPRLNNQKQHLIITRNSGEKNKEILTLNLDAAKPLFEVIHHAK